MNAKGAKAPKERVLASPRLGSVLLSPSMVLVAACASSALDGRATAPRPAADESFIDEDGTMKPRGGGTAALSPVGLADDIVRVRCIVSTEGVVFGCSQLSGPRVVEDRLVAALKKVRVAPALEDGKPVEARRTFAFRVGFVMR